MARLAQRLDKLERERAKRAGGFCVILRWVDPHTGLTLEETAEDKRKIAEAERRGQTVVVVRGIDPNGEAKRAAHGNPTATA